MWKQIRLRMSATLGDWFVVLSILVFKMDVIKMKNVNGAVSFILGVLACIAVIGLVMSMDGKRSTATFAFLAKYTMPIFVMHTLFAAPLRALLLKVSINNGLIHVVGGLVISFVGPIIAAEMMKKTKILEFFLYPGKFIKI